MWLVTPLISKLQEGVLGRVLKSAGNVLGQGQWWNQEKNQEKRRATRATRYKEERDTLGAGGWDLHGYSYLATTSSLIRDFFWVPIC